jgi:glucan endo-1,3-alpha-glucosidase
MVLTSHKPLLTKDYGESHYFYKTKGALPAGSEAWVDGFDHSAWADLLPFFIRAYKANHTIDGSAFATKSSNQTSALASIPVKNLKDTVVFWYRPHPKDAVASSDPLPQPTGGSFPDDDLVVIAILEAPATIVINSGSKSESYAAIKGFNQITLEGFQEGEQQVEVVRNGVVVSCGIGEVPISSSIEKYNFNAVVGKAVPGGCAA